MITDINKRINSSEKYRKTLEKEILRTRSVESIEEFIKSKKEKGRSKDKEEIGSRLKYPKIIRSTPEKDTFVKNDELEVIGVNEKDKKEERERSQRKFGKRCLVRHKD